MSKLTKVRQALHTLSIDALFITDQLNVSYLTDFIGLAPNEREGFFFITRKDAFLLTFPTYFGLYEKGGNGFITLNITQTKKLSDHLTEIINNGKIQTVGFEKENLTVAEFASLRNKFQPLADRPLAEKVSFIETEGIIEKLRLLKDEKELHSIRKAAQITDSAFDFIKTKIKKGATEKDLALELEFFLKKNAGNIAFSPIVAFDGNAAIPHYLPNNRQQLTNNNLILLDFGARVNGYCSDMTRVIFYGTPNNNYAKVYRTVLKAQQLALENLKTNISAELPDKIARKYIKSQNFPDYPHGLGHGVGLAIHEAPRLKIGSREILKENMVVTVEPGIYLPGECGIRIEDLVVLKRDGIEILSKSPKLFKELII